MAPRFLGRISFSAGTRPDCHCESYQCVIRQSSPGYYQFGPHGNPQEWSELGDHYYQHYYELVGLCGNQ